MASHDQQWYMDTGATSHLSSHTGNLQTSSLNRNFNSVIVRNGSFIPVTHSGHLQIPNPYRPLHLKNVLVTPNIIKNLVFVRKFTTDNKCSIDFDPYGFTHQRLGHPGDNVIQTLSSRGLVSYHKQNTQHLCRACQLGKQTKLPFQQSTTIVTSPFDIIHSDLWTSPVSSMSGYKYYVIFFDHYSHFLWVYPLHRKSDEQSKLLHFRAFVKTQFNREIKAFQCDHGGEFDNNSLHELFATNGIQFRFSCPHTSQQNGKSECMIRSINNVVRSLLFQARLPPEYWVEALLTTAYLLNILPSTSINNDISYTKLFNKPPSYTHLRTFGCLCYPYTFPPHKLAPRTTPSIFLGYPYNHRGYRCLDLNTNKIIISRHVTFDETVFPFGSMTPTKPPSYKFLDDNLDTSPIALRLLTTPTSPQQTPPQTTPQTNPQTTPQSTPPTPLSTPSPQTTPTPPTTPPPPPPPPTSQHPMVTRSKVGIVKANPKYNLHVTTSSPIPKSPFHALRDPNWKQAMCDEYKALIDNNTWVLVPRPPNVNIVRSMWLYKHKYNADGSLNRYKARLVANGRSQQQGIDCDETFSPVVKPATIRTVLSLAVSRQWPIHQLDVKNAFLHGHLKETVYMHQPPGFTDSTHRIFCFYHSKTDSSLFIFHKGPDTAYLLLYVDDIILTASSTSLLQRIISSLHAEFAMTDLGPLNYFLGISATRTTSGIFLSQKKYATEILEQAQMLNCNPCRTLVDTEKKLGPEGSPVTDPTLYRSLAGSLQYLTFTRPDLSYAVQQLCLYMHDPREPHHNAMNRVLRYLRGTTDLGLQLFRSSTSQLITYSDADWAGCPATRRSTSRYCVFLGDNLLTWSSKCQDTLSCSSAEAEYRGVANAVAETSWIRNLLRELHTPLSTATLVYCDNVSVVYMSANLVQHQRTKHIEIDIHFVRDKVAAGHVRVLHVPSRFQYADIFTKGLPYPLFADFRSSLSVRKSPAPTAGAY
ncbi:ribonuclease H-like domain-containing protein [Tanacetum coccineum]